MATGLPVNKAQLSGRAAMRFKIGLLAALMAIAPVAAVGWTTYAAASRSLVQEVEKYNHLAMKQVQQRTDDMMRTIDRTVMQHVVDDPLNVRLREGTVFEDEYELSRLMTTLSAMETLIDHAEAVYLYVRQQDALVTVNGVDRNPRQALGDSLYDKLLHNRDPSFWHDRLTPSAEDVADTHGVIGGLSYARRLPASFADPLGYFVVLLREQALFDKFDYTELQQTGGSMMAVSPDGNLYTDEETHRFVQEHVPPETLKLWLSAERPEDGRISSTRTVGQREWLIHGVKSPESSWLYLSVVPVDELTRQIREVKQVVLTVCLLLALVALAAFLLLTTNIYGRVRRIIDGLQSDKHALEHQVSEAEPDRRAYWVQQWLNGPSHPEELERLEKLGFPMQHSRYAAVCLEWDDFRLGGDGHEANRRFERLLDFVRRLEQAEMTMTCAFTRLGPDRLGAVLIQPAGDRQPVPALEDWCRGLQGQIRDELRLDVYLGIGEIRTDAEQVCRSFEESQRALGQRLVEPGKHVFTHESIVRTQKPMVYPFEQEKRIVSHLKLGETDHAVQFLRDFINQLLTSRELDERQVQQSLAMLLASVLRILFDGNTLSDSALFPYNAYEKLKELKSIREIEEWLIRDVFGRVARQVMLDRRQRESVGDGVVRKAMDYVQQHYDEDLSLSMLAEQTGLPEPQLSQMFKRETGLTFTDYMISVRIEKAKELLRTTDMKVADIAERMKYNNSQNFIRVFKRIAGLTPGEYRKRHQGE